MLAALGLGNPGSEYEGTRHNIGKEAIISLAERLELILSPGRGKFFYAYHAAADLVLAISTSYVNASGISASQVAEQFDLTPDRLLVVCDDFYLPLGTARIRKKGSDGGHNGLASVIFQLASQDFPRLRIGIGPLPPNNDPADFVLSRFQPEEEHSAGLIKEVAAEAILTVVNQGIDKAMSIYNRRVER